MLSLIRLIFQVQSIYKRGTASLLPERNSPPSLSLEVTVCLLPERNLTLSSQGGTDLSHQRGSDFLLQQIKELYITVTLLLKNRISPLTREEVSHLTRGIGVGGGGGE